MTTLLGEEKIVITRGNLPKQIMMLAASEMAEIGGILVGVEIG